MTSTSNEGAWQPSLNVSRVNKHRLWLKCNTRYDVVVMAWNRRGHSDFNGASMLSVLTETGTDLKGRNVKQQSLCYLTFYILLWQIKRN